MGKYLQELASYEREQLRKLAKPSKNEQDLGRNQIVLFANVCKCLWVWAVVKLVFVNSQSLTIMTKRLQGRSPHHVILRLLLLTDQSVSYLLAPPRSALDLAAETSKIIDLAC